MSDRHLRPASSAAPHFVGIGAPRCGTTWVYKLLRLHPAVWMPWKEVHYFDSVDPETESGFRIQDRRFRWSRGWLYAARRLAAGALPGSQPFMRRYFPMQAVGSPGLRWTARYLLGDASLSWYRDLFREGLAAGLRCGEITPAYFMLSPAAISGFAEALPDTRVFLFLRNPLEWAWSDLCKRLRARGQDPSGLSDAELIAHCSVPTGRSRADFGSNLRRWSDAIPAERLFIGYHEEIRADPDELMSRLCDFIGIEPLPPRVRKLLGERVNSSARGLPMPPAVERHVAGRFLDETALMARLLGGRASRWHADLQQVLARPSRGA